LERAEAPKRDRFLLTGEDEREHRADDRRLEEHDRGAGAIAGLYLPVAAHEQHELP